MHHQRAAAATARGRKNAQRALRGDLASPTESGAGRPPSARSGRSPAAPAR